MTELDFLNQLACPTCQKLVSTVQPEKFSVNMEGMDLITGERIKLTKGTKHVAFDCCFCGETLFVVPYNLN